jgi:hypothetical protein
MFESPNSICLQRLEQIPQMTVRMPAISNSKKAPLRQAVSDSPESSAIRDIRAIRGQKIVSNLTALVHQQEWIPKLTPQSPGLPIPKKIRTCLDFFKKPNRRLTANHTESNQFGPFSLRS